MSNITYLLAWWLVVSLFGIIVYPLARRVAPGLADAYGFSRLFGVLLFTYLSWVLSFLTGYTPTVTGIVLLVMCAAGILFFRLEKPGRPSLFVFYETLFAGSFLLFALIRSFYPSIRGSEKFMDFAILNAVSNARTFPALDPWLSGGYLDFYYYFGHLIVATLAKLTGTPGEAAYNLGLAMFFALATTVVASLGYNLTGKKSYALLSVFFVLVSGNLKSIVLVFERLYQGLLPDVSYYWESSRVIPNTVNEFPGFTFLHGDLHAHLAGIPLQLLVILVLLNLHRSCRTRDVTPGTALFTGFALGFLFPTQSWDYPTYLFITIMVMVCQLGVTRPALSRLIIIIASSLFFFTPFYSDFAPLGVNGLGFVSARTGITDYALVFGIVLTPIVFFMLNRAAPKLKRVCPVRILLAIGGFTVLFFISLLLDFHLLAPLLILLTLCLVILKKAFSNIARCPEHQRTQETTLKKDDFLFIVILVFTGLLVSLFCEVFYFNDSFAQPLERFNTVFKLYMQVWILFTTAMVYSIYHLTPLVHGVWKKLWFGMLALMIIGGLIFPVTTIIVKTNGFSAEPGLDGMSYMEQEYPGDYHAIKWMRANLPFDSVVLEQRGESYTLTSRIATNTGIPTVLGWAGHEIIWRADAKTINQRFADAEKMYTSQNITETFLLLKKYNVTHVYIGGIEEEQYGQGLLKFENNMLFKPVYTDNKNSTILYEVTYDNYS